MTMTNYFRLPNSLVTDGLTASDIRVMAYLYSLPASIINSPSYKVIVRQAVIADRCYLSIETVARCIKRLISSGYITDAKRNRKINGYWGTYTYSLKAISGGYFRVSRIALKLSMNSSEFKLFMLMSKCKDNDKGLFFHSYSDLAQMMGCKRSNVISLVSKLIKAHVISKHRYITKCKDAGENRYYVLAYVQGKIKKSPLDSLQSKGEALFLRKENNLHIQNTPKGAVCQVFFQNYFSYRGGG